MGTAVERGGEGEEPDLASDARERRLAWLRHSLTGTGEVLRAMAEASPGPWWGFNGIRTVAVTDQRLWSVRSTLLGHGSGRDRTRVTGNWVALADVRAATGVPRVGLLGQPAVWTLRLQVTGRRGLQMYTLMDVEAGQRLTALLSRTAA